MAFSHFAVPQESQWQTVEEVLAVVGNTPILFSDITLAEAVRLADQQPDEPIESYRSRLLDARIRLEVEFREIEEGGLLYRLELDTPRVRNLLITRGGGEEALGSNLQQNGLIWPDLDELALRLSAVEAFVEQRLRPRISVSIEEIEVAYQQLLVAEIAASDEPVPPLATVREHLHRIVVERKLNEEIERWLDRARDRQEVMRFSR
jgi:hypothetical protein